MKMSGYFVCIGLLSLGPLFSQSASSVLSEDQQDSLTSYTKKNIGLGLHLGFGSGFNTGSFGDHYSPNISMSFGGDFIYKRYVMSLDITSNTHDLETVYVGDETFDESAGTDVINLSIGYSLIDMDRFKLTPFVGLGYMEFSTDNSLNEHIKENDLNWVFGVSADYKYRRKAKFKSNSFLPVNRYKESSFQAKILVTRVNFYDDFGGYLVNFSLGFSWQAKGITQ